jgi:hypothetical protein
MVANRKIRIQRYCQETERDIRYRINDFTIMHQTIDWLNILELHTHNEQIF